MNKYKNRKITYEGIRFDSMKECNRYRELKLLERAKEIKDLELQKKFILQEGFRKNNKTYLPIKYIADFVYFDIRKNKTIVEDTKGIKTDVYKIKKKMFEKRYENLEILET